MTIHGIIVAATIASFGVLGQVSGCAQVTVPDATTVVKDVTGLCSYVPLVQDVEVTLKANPTITNATALANLICTAFVASQPKGVHPGVGVEHDVTVVIDGKKFVIHGHAA